MGYNYGYDTIGSMNSGAAMGLGALIWTIISLLAAVVGCFLIYFMFVKKDNKPKNKTLAWLRDFLRFDKMLIETILKIAYIFAAIFLTLFSFTFFSLGFVGFLFFLLTITFGNICLRIIYEGLLIKVMIWKNTTEIKNNLKK